MCGICGVISNKKLERNCVLAMSHSMSHRGPNGEGTYFEDNLGIAMRRLSIIDLEGGWQPIYSEDGSLILFMNGEIYNYIELRNELKQKGHIFSTNSDAEVVVHLYEDHETNCFTHLRGMFAIALWDTKAKRLILARDRMGEKPLYLYKDECNFIFASELRTILASGLIEKNISAKAVDMFFHYQYIPEPYTILENVRKLPPASFIVINQDLSESESVYWRMEDAPVLSDNPYDVMYSCLNEVGKLIIRSDVPVGVALSGGIDSSLVAALASRQYGNQMHAFTVGYEGHPATDERNVAKRIADYLGMTFHEIELTTKSFVQSFPLICQICDDPIADISAFGYYSVSKAAKEMNVSVLLQGQGGDELAWGYKWVRDCYRISELKDSIRAGNFSAQIKLFELIAREQLNNPRIRKYGIDVLGIFRCFQLIDFVKKNPNALPFYNVLHGFDSDYSTIYGNFLKDRLAYHYIFESNIDDIAVALTKLICNTYLLENGIAQGDRLSMVNSVELRLPLIDYQLVETIIGLRKNRNDIFDSPKKIFTDVARQILPDWLFTIPKKGFTPPVKLWLGELLSSYNERLVEGNLTNFEILNKKAAKRLSRGLRSPSIGFPLFFNALVLEFYLDALNN